MHSLTGRTPYPARLAYDLAAAEYDSWPWQEFWHRTEAPIVLSWLETSASRRLLDLGAGTGFYLRQLAVRGFCCTGLDISAAMLGIAANRLGGAAALVQGDAQDLPFMSGSFDQILMTRVASHIKNLAAVLQEIRMVLAEDGSLIVSDLDPAHNYTHTELPLEGEKIPVETYKRTLSELLAVAKSQGLTLLRHTVIGGQDVPNESTSKFPSSIDIEGNRPVAFVAQFKIC
jgi:ubiquinone/menaquinone biosynthesis C-methylase UbiE